MASLSLTPPVLISKTPFVPSIQIKSQHFVFSKRTSSSISCNVSQNQNSDDHHSPTPPPPLRLDRRNVLLGLGGMYGSAAGMASAAPILPPDLSKCKKQPDTVPKGVVTECCPPYSPDIIDYRPPLRLSSKPRVRPAAHSADPAYVKKYEEALAIMKGLDEDDPRSFSQQAKIHCAYCNGAYNQVGFGELDIQVHNSWLFFPFHRWYLYFYERILGSLIKDPTFAIPFWNWDIAPGMQMPAMFTDKNSTLYDANRSSAHQPPYVVDLDFYFQSPDDPINDPKPDDQQIKENLSTMYKQMVSGAKTQTLFFGTAYRAGDGNGKAANKSPGTIENSPHTQLHVLSGYDKTESAKTGLNKNGEDMGSFYSAGRDPMFYCHHGNVDRMWSVWKTLGGKKRRDISDPDWLNAGFLFYDENKQLVRVKVGDCLDTRRLGYVYEDADISPWLKSKPKPKSRKGKGKKTASLIGEARAADNNRRVALSDFPITLEKSLVSVEVPRPKKGRSKAEKDEEEEVLVVEGIEFDGEVALKFDVYLNDEDEGFGGALTPDQSEFAGTFANVPQGMKNSSMPQKVSLRLGISDLLEDIGADDDDTVIVTLIPRTKDPVSIDGIKIELES